MKYDSDNTGNLNIDEFKEFIRNIDESLREPDIEFVFKQLDLDGGG
jgi:Ca2+-binding EF-hand superfamily protein